MQLIGMLDSPYVRRVAISMMRLGLPFQRHDWSVGADFDRIRQFSPLGRVPALVLDDGTVLVDSMSILDALDDLVGPSRALLPVTGTPRREALRLMTLATGAAEKSRDQVYERMVRPPEKFHEPWVARCREQMHGALGELEKACAHLGPSGWLVADRFTQADITVGCISTLLDDVLGVFAEGAYPALKSHDDRCEGLPEFQATRSKWFAAEMQK
ncbi:MAG TPA: glutathione S-transferase family protein [Steroidobacteraceae bacterium]|jgi:glutathione S-transferase|nr:glutathione S-transferase family protein [Steroidobacteraceae bacterium]